MIVYLNRQFLPADQARISVFDRGFLYGDGLFETLRVHQGRPLLWPAHMSRLYGGAEVLKLSLPVNGADLRAVLDELLRLNDLRDAVVRINASRGTGKRGYSIRESGPATLAMAAFHAPPLGTGAPPAWRLRTSSLAIPGANPLSPFKTTNRLVHVMARAEAEGAGADEALLLNGRGNVAEASTANIFWFEGGSACTPALDEGGLAGVTRAFVMEVLRGIGLPCQEVARSPDALRQASGHFLTLSSLGIVEVSDLDGVRVTPDARTERVRQAYEGAVKDQLSD